MMMGKVGLKLVAVALICLAGLGWMVLGGLQEGADTKGKRKGPRAVPVEVAPVERGPIELRRTFSGTLEATAEFVVAPKVSGHVERVLVDLADVVNRGQVVARLDDGEYVQAVVQAKADLAVSRANAVEAQNALEIAQRELRRIETLHKRGVTSEAQLDTARANQLARQSQLEVARAQVIRAEAALETANIRLRYTKVTADWTGGSEQRVVSERYVDEGGTVSANTPLLSIVELNPITGVIFVTEKDYSYLRRDQPVFLTTDAYPDEIFEGRIDRIAPVFRQTTRQARVELKIEDARQRLKPGMFMRATVVLKRVAEAIIVPERALTTRDDRSGVYVVNEDGRTVVFRKVSVGIREGGRVQVQGEGLKGLVVTLGQQLVGDGTAVTIISEDGKSALPAREEGAR